jgi:myosin-1
MKKPGKVATVKVVKEANPSREDIYKSGVIHTGPGEPRDSVSRPTPRGRQGVRKPITSGKLLRPGGPKGRPTQQPTAVSRPAAQANPAAAVTSPATTNRTSYQSQPQTMSTASSSATPLVAQAAAAAAMPQATPAQKSISEALPTHVRTTSTTSARAAPPAPPLPVAVYGTNYRALYDFNAQGSNELSLRRDEIVVVLQKESNGKSNCYTS